MNKDFFVHLFHILIVGGLFLYVGINRNKIPNYMYPILLSVGVIIVLYHGYKMYNHIKLNQSYWVSLIHIFIVGPLLIYISYNSSNTKRYFFEILLMLGFAAIGYHLYYLLYSFYKNK